MIATIEDAEELRRRAERAEHLLRVRDRQARLSREFWVRAAEAALRGDPRELRNRVEMAKAPPLDVVLSQPGDPQPPASWASATNEGEVCSLCGEPASDKLAEEIASDDPFRHRHPLTCRLCPVHFRALMGERGVELRDWARGLAKGEVSG